jgi:AcrR family transcriptional regulator
MRTRSDGLETRKRVLDAACEVFAARGYRAATVSEICRRARANIAAVNYHFGNKRSLYVAVWRDAACRALQRHPLDGGVPATAPAEQRLRGLLLSLVRRMTDKSQLGAFHRLRLMEMANPTGLIDQVRWQVIRPLRDHTRALLRELAGRRLTLRELDHCEMSVIGPCLMAQMIQCHPQSNGAALLAPIHLDAFVDHCVRFALAGLGARRNGAPTRSRRTR